MRRMKKNTILSVILFIYFLADIVPIVYCDIWDPYHRKDELIGMFKALCDAHPKYASYESVGKTYEGKDIWIFKIGNLNGGRVLWDGQLHGNEDKGSEIIYLITRWLLESGDSKAKRILERNYVLFIPVVNMDSYGRENARGVNLNRNFVTGWSSTAAENPGPSPASEPETQVMRSVFQTYRPHFYLNMHVGAGPYLSYYRYANVTPANETIGRINEISSEMGVTPFPTHAMGSTGFAIGDASSFGASSWLIEIEPQETAWRHTESLYQDLVNIYYPKCLAIFIAMCEVCEVKTPSSTPQHYLLVVSDYGNISGGGWYDHGATAYAMLDKGRVSADFMYDWVFKGWSWDASGTSLTSNPIIMDEHKTVIAQWEKQFSMQFYLTIAAAATIVAVSTGIILRKRKA